MERKIAEFVQLIEQALTISQQIKLAQEYKPLNDERLNTLMTVLKSLKNQVISRQLEPSRGVLTLGLSREVADWMEPLESPLLKAIGAIEQYYQKYF